MTTHEESDALSVDDIARHKYRKVFKIARKAGSTAELARGHGVHRWVRLSLPSYGWAADVVEGPYGPPDAGMRVWQVTDRTRYGAPKNYVLETWDEAKTIIKAIVSERCVECAVEGALCVPCSDADDATWD